MSPPPRKPPTSAKMVQGPLDKVPCPHCGRPNDLGAELLELNLVERGTVVGCDGCGRKMEIIKVVPVTMVAVRQFRAR